MTRLAVLEYPDPRLRLRAREVRTFDPRFATLVDDLFETLYASGGLGLAAPQVGVAEQVLVMDLSGTASAPEVYVNPRILSCGPTQGMVEESCLSLPGITGDVKRALGLRVQAQDRNGQRFERDLENLAAVCLQHEMDHLTGRLFIDHLSMFRRLAIRARAGQRARTAGTQPGAPEA